MKLFIYKEETKLLANNQKKKGSKMKIDICTGRSRKDKKWNYQEIDLNLFKKRISTTVRTGETMAEYKKMTNSGHGLCHSRYYG